MFKNIKKFSFFITYFLKILNIYLNGLLLTNSLIIFYIARSNLINTIIFLKYNLIASANSLLDIIAIDQMHSNHRFEITYVFWNIYYGYRFGIKLFLTQLNSIISISKYFPNSNWLEREVWDMFGIRFILHTNLSRILTDYGFKGYPLRKDFPLSGYIDLTYDNSQQAIRYLPLEFSQNMRFFNLINPWN